MRRVAAVEHQRVAVRVAEERHVADAGVEDLALELDAHRLQLATRPLDVGHPQCDRRGVRPFELLPDVRGIEEIEADVLAQLELRPATLARDPLQTERFLVEASRTLEIRYGHRDEVGALDDQPTEPSICSWISRFISTAYSSGSSFVIGSTKPDTISADDSASESPRDIR